jgi:dTDP-4-dehydrorhamnose reductase
VWGAYSSHPVEIEGCRMEAMDLLSPGDVARLVKKSVPAVIIHAAAFVDVDLCERDRGLARRINEEGTRIVAELAAETGARLIYCSTDMVFDGTKGMYTEQDSPRPVNYYGATKLAAERWVRSLCPGGMVARLALMYGLGNSAHGSFLSWMIQRLERGEPVNLFTDQFRTPTFVEDVCRAVERILERPDAAGVYHLAGPERMNRYEFGTRAADIFGFPRELLRAVRMSDVRELIPRPADNSLDNRKAEGELGIRFRSVTEGLRAIAEERRG